MRKNFGNELKFIVMIEIRAGNQFRNITFTAKAFEAKATEYNRNDGSEQNTNSMVNDLIIHSKHLQSIIEVPYAKSFHSFAVEECL